MKTYLTTTRGKYIQRDFLKIYKWLVKSGYLFLNVIL